MTSPGRSVSVPFVEDVSDVPGTMYKQDVLRGTQYVRRYSMHCGLCEYRMPWSSPGAMVKLWALHCISHTE